jgi:hypothetical protein
MRISAKRLTDGRRWRAVAWILLIAFTLQSYVTQTHIHGISQSFDAGADAKTLAASPAHQNAPADKSAQDCPFCQAIIHSGAFFAPAAPFIPQPVWVASVVQVIAAQAAVAVAAIVGWQSRAPPQA